MATLMIVLVVVVVAIEEFREVFDVARFEYRGINKPPAPLEVETGCTLRMDSID